MEHAYTDPSGRQSTIIITGDATTSGIRHHACNVLATVSPDLDAAYCPQCRWQCRISGAWYTDLLATTKALTEASGADVAVDPALEAALLTVVHLIGTPVGDPDGLAMLIAAIDKARAEANWTPWWLKPVIPTTPSDEYYDGVRDGIRAHATWSGGEQLVGALRKPIATVIADVDTYQAERRYWRFG